MSNISEIKKLEEKRSRVTGAGNIGKLRQLEYSLQLFERNYDMLSKLLNHLTEKKQHTDLFNRTNRWRTQLLFKEISFRLHNFVASSLSLVDHSRIVYKKSFKDKGHFKVYQDKVDLDLKDNELIQFIQKLRQMCQHYRLPHISAEWKMKGSELSLYLQKEDLLQFDGWNKKSKTYIKESGDKINLLKAIDKYYEQIKTFHTWVKKEFSELYGEEIMSIHNYSKKINEKKSDIIIEELEMALESEKDKIHYNLKFAISGALPPDEMQALSQYENDNKKWILKSIDYLNNYIDVPDNIIKRIKSLCK